MDWADTAEPWEKRLLEAHRHLESARVCRLEASRYRSGYYRYCDKPQWWGDFYAQIADRETAAAKELMEGTDEQT